MPTKSVLLLICGTLIIGATAGGVAFYQERQRLGRPGILYEEVAGQVAVKLQIPEEVEGYRSESLPVTREEKEMLPSDTSFARRRYVAADGLSFDLSIVLMGGDQSSIHRPQACIPAQGWTIVTEDLDTVTVDGPVPYELEYNRLRNKKQILIEGAPVDAEGYYVFWFAADGKLTASREERILSTALHMLTSGEVERWAYVSVHVAFPAGVAEQVYPRIKEFVRQVVPRFQPGEGKSVPAQ